MTQRGVNQGDDLVDLFAAHQLARGFAHGGRVGAPRAEITVPEFIGRELAVNFDRAGLLRDFGFGSRRLRSALIGIVGDAEEAAATATELPATTAAEATAAAAESATTTAESATTTAESTAAAPKTTAAETAAAQAAAKQRRINRQHQVCDRIHLHHELRFRFGRRGDQKHL